MTTTQAQIAKIVTLLTGITSTVPTTKTVPVFGQYTNSSDSYPYIFISDGAVSYRDMDFGTYEVSRQYKISLVAQFEPNQADVRIAESQLRELLNKVEEILKTKSTRNNGWQDSKILSTSEPFNGAEMSFTDDTVIRQITVEIKDTEACN